MDSAALDPADALNDAAPAAKQASASTLSQFFPGKHEPRDGLIPLDRIDDFPHVGRRDVTVEDVIWLNQDGDAGGALVEAARAANTRFELRKSARLQLLFQLAIDLLGTTSSTGAFLMAFSSPVRANKEIALSQRHAAGWQSWTARSTRAEQAKRFAAWAIDV